VDSQRSPHVDKGRSRKGGDREAAFFEALRGQVVVLQTCEQRKRIGKLLWVGPYSLIIDRRGNQELYWKHALESICRGGNGRDD